MRAVLERHEGPLLSYALRLLGGDLERARDVVQDVFLRLVRADRAEVAAHLAPWLFRVCRNRALDVKRDVGRAAEPGADADRGADERDAGPLARLEVVDEVARVHAALARLPEREAELVRLKFEHGLSYDEMGEVTGLTAGNVGFLLHRALRTLRERLGAPEPRRDAAARREHAS